jgi:ribosomal protein L24
MKGKGFLKKLLPIHISNIMYYVEGEKKPTKIKITVDKKWKKVRESKKFKTVLK